MENFESTSKEICLYDQSLKCVPIYKKKILKCTPRDMGKIQECYMGKIAKPCDIRDILTLICCCLALVLFYRIFISFDTKSIANHILMALCGISGLLVVLIDFYYNYKVEFYVCSDGLAEYVYEYDKKSNLLQYISKNEYHFNEIDYLQKMYQQRILQLTIYGSLNIKKE